MKQLLGTALFALLLMLPKTALADPTTLANWTFEPAYDVSGLVYTPNTSASSDVTGWFKDGQPVILPNTFVGTQADYAITGKSARYWQFCTGYNNRVLRIENTTEANEITDYTDAVQHLNYYEVSFPATGYKDITVSYAIAYGANAAVDIVAVVSTDGGTTWTKAGTGTTASGWWLYNENSVTLAVSNLPEVKVRLLFANDCKSNWNLDYLTITGTAITSETFYTITATPDDSSHGFAELSPAGGSYESGAAVTATATNKTGYLFKEWQVGGTAVSTDNPYSFTASANTALVAVFNSGMTYTLTTNSSPAYTGKVTRSAYQAEYDENTPITLTATANTGYEFATSTNGSSTVTAKINGNEANVARIQNTAATDELCIYYTFPEAKNEVVSTVAVTGVTPPKSGAAPSYSAVVNDSKYKVYTDYSNMSGYSKGVRWWNATDKTFVNPSTDKFHAGKQYTCEVLLMANIGYEFKTDSSGYSKVTGTFNNNTASVMKFSGQDAKSVVCVEYKFNALAKEKISEVKVINLPEPKLGEAPSYLPSTVGAGYSIKKDYTSTSFKEGVRWVDLDGEGVIDHTSGHKFIEGHKYRCDILLQVNDDYEFDTLGYIDATINGKEAAANKMSGHDEKSVIVVEYTFEAIKANIISTVAISGIDAPAAGKKPDYTAVVNGVGYEMATYAGTVWEVEKICWVNGTDIKYMQNMNGSEVVYDNFEAGKIYACTVLLKAKDGYTFAMNGSNTAVTATLNGNTAGVTTVNDVAPQNKYIQVTFNFGECPDNGSDDPDRIYGDVNNDGKITSADSLLILRASVNLENFDELTTKLADVDENSKITSADSLEVLRYSVSLPSPTKVGQIYK